jgi:hypothetical protein
MDSWHWLDFDDRVVGTSPRRAPDHLTGDPHELLERFADRLDEVKRRRQRAQAHA